MMETCTGTRDSGKQVLCVWGDVSSNGDGSAAMPFKTINAALTKARDGDVIQVAGREVPGSQLAYRENILIGNYQNTCDNGGTRKNIVFLGGFNRLFSDRNADQYPTLVIGQSTSPAFQVCVVQGETIIDGFHITTEKTNRGINALVGAFSNEPGKIIISHNKVFDNRNPRTTLDDMANGGGIMLKVNAGASGEVSNNHVYNNESARGSGIATQTSRRNGQWSQVLILRNRVENNISRGSHGGGMNVSGAGEIAYNLVLNNQLLGSTPGWGGGWGAGIFAEGQSAYAPVYAHHNVVMGNYGAGYGGAGEFYDEDVDARVEYDLVASNKCSYEYRSSEIMADMGSAGRTDVSLKNVTVLNHVCAVMGNSGGALMLQPGSHVVVTNSIFWNNIGSSGNKRDFGQQDPARSTLSVTSTTSGQSISGADNSTTDPQLENPATGRYRSLAFPNRGAFAPGGLNPNP